ncbi:phage tail protein [Synechococcus elongatus]|uniref:phage tail protein n=1 Tax=Synechococcus elongatus TaxID=32046 RepID=UPI000F7F16B3|nr:phage tail protein [Synechococcus elongatus]
MDRNSKSITGAGFESAIDIGLVQPGFVLPFEVEVGGVGNKNTIFFRFEIQQAAEVVFEKIRSDRYSEATSYFSIVGPNREELPIDESLGIANFNGSTLLPPGEYFILAGGSEFKLPTRVEFVLEIGGGSPVWPDSMPLQMNGRSNAIWASGSAQIWVDGSLEISLDGVTWFTGSNSRLQVRSGTSYAIRLNPSIGITQNSGDVLTGRIYSSRDNSSFLYSITVDALPDPDPLAFPSINNREQTGLATAPSLFAPQSFNVPINLWLGFYETSPTGAVWTAVPASPASDVQVRINNGDWVDIRNTTSPTSAIVLNVGDSFQLRHIQKSTFNQFTRSIVRLGRAGNFSSYTFSSQTQPAMEVPPGTVVYWANPATIPERWLVLNGQSFSLAQYPMLAPLYPTGVLPSKIGTHFRWNTNSALGSTVASTSGTPSAVTASNIAVTVDSSVVSASSDGSRQSATTGLHTHTFNSTGQQIELITNNGLLHVTNGFPGSGAIGHFLSVEDAGVDDIPWGFTASSPHSHSFGPVIFETNPDHSHLVTVSTNFNHSHAQTSAIVAEIPVDNGQETKVRSLQLIPIVYGGLPPV